MIWLILGLLVFAAWLIGRRGMRIIVLLLIVVFFWGSVVNSYQESKARAEGVGVIQ